MLLIVNAGSSTLKVSLFAGDFSAPRMAATFETSTTAVHGELHLRTGGQQDVETIQGNWASTGDRLRYLCKLFQERGVIGPTTDIARVGHRVVHGGTRFSEPTVLDADVHREIIRLRELAPLHNPPAIDAIEAAREVLPEAMHVAVFDTAYFTMLPEHRRLYPLPHEWAEEYGIRRFGFHGISHAWCAARAAELLGRDPAEVNVITCHLGSGCSITATERSCAVATSMGFTPLDGIMMGTRPGSLDPGILLHLLNEKHFTLDELATALNRRSGLAGVSGISADVRTLEAAAERGDRRAELALEMFADRARGMIGQMAASLGHVDAVVFTAGIGENSATVRARTCRGLEILGAHLDPDGNRSMREEGEISTADSPVRILVIRSREDVAMARSVESVAKPDDRE